MHNRVSVNSQLRDCFDRGVPGTRVTSLKDQIVPPLHNAMHENAEATLQSIAHYSGEKIVVKTIHDVLPKLSNTLAEIITKTMEDQMAASQVLQDLDLALKQGALNGGGPLYSTPQLKPP